MAYIDRLDLFNGLNLNPIPLEFSQGLTTTEWLLGIQAKVNSIVLVLNDFEDIAGKYTDEEIKKVMERITSNYTTINSLIDTVKNEQKQYTDGEINSIATVVTTLTNNMNNAVSNLNIKDLDLQTEIDLLFKMLNKGQVFVNNPVNGKTLGLQNVIDALYELINSSSTGEYFTSEMYDLLGLTCQQYEDLVVGARSYDSNWQTIFYTTP